MDSANSVISNDQINTKICNYVWGLIENDLQDGHLIFAIDISQKDYNRLACRFSHIKQSIIQRLIDSGITLINMDLDCEYELGLQQPSRRILSINLSEIVHKPTIEKSPDDKPAN